jgi:hypothetical protein
MEGPHAFDGHKSIVLRMIGTPRMVHVHRIDPAGERELVQKLDKFIDRELVEWLRHDGSPVLVRGFSVAPGHPTMNQPDGQYARDNKESP